MKTFGVKTLIASCILVLGFLTALLSIGDSVAIAIVLPVIIGVTQVVNAPVIRVSKSSFSVSTPNPFYKNIHINIADVEKITVDTNSYSMRFIVHKKDGSILSTTTGYYSIDLKPLYEALQETGVVIEGHGYRTTDWA